MQRDLLFFLLRSDLRGTDAEPNHFYRSKMGESFLETSRSVTNEQHWEETKVFCYSV